MANQRDVVPFPDEQVNDLLLRWQELRHRGPAPFAQELCADCPELAEPLKEKMRAFEAMEALLGLGANHPTDPPIACQLPPSTPSLPGASADENRERPPSVHIPGYEILSVLDQGGMGIVYKARQLALNRLVAIKMILAGAFARPDQLARFRAEAVAVAQLQHPHIVQIHEVGECAGQPYFTMEFVAGGSLACRLAKGPMPPAQAAELTESLARAMQAAHDRGIVHRDLKPANILLASGGREPPVDGFNRGHEPAFDGSNKEHAPPVDGSNRGLTPPARQQDVPKITDFGLAKRLGAETGQTRTGAILGTPSYLAPEQADGQNRDVGPAADIHALGAILYETLTGRPPFQGVSTLDTLEQVRSREPVPPSRLQPKVPRDLETICLKCLEKEPRRRYVRAAELADDLKCFRAGEPIRARPTPWWERGLKWAQRRPAQAGLLVVSTAAVVGLLAAWIGFTAELRAERNYAREQELIAKNNEQYAKQQEQIAQNNERLAEIRRQDAQRQRDAATKQYQHAQAILARCRAVIEQSAQAAVTAKNATRAPAEPHALLFELARSYSASSTAFLKDKDLPREDREKLAEQYAASSLFFLRKAWQAGFFRNPVHLRKLQGDKDLAPLRSRADFQDLKAEIEINPVLD